MSSAKSASLTAIDALAGDESRLWEPVVRAMRVDGAAISTVAEFLDIETVSASDETATHIDEVQFDLGEGPCWDAVRLQRPILEPDLRDRPPDRWPAFLDAIATDDIGAIFAFPLVLGSLKLGAMDLYTRDPRPLGTAAVANGSRIATAVSRLVLARALRLAQLPYEAEITPLSRRIIHQAAGVVLAQLEVSVADATLIIQGHAFAAGRPVRDIAEDIVERRITFGNATGEIQGSDD